VLPACCPDLTLGWVLPGPAQPSSGQFSSANMTWMPRSCRGNDMNAASTPYAAGAGRLSLVLMVPELLKSG
jgi:hypothetical protein